MNISNECPEIEVGIIFSPLLHFRLNGEYLDPSTGIAYTGEYHILKEGNKYRLYNNRCEQTVELPLTFLPVCYDRNDFDLMDVTIGIHFHWERKEDQKFKGTLKIIDEGTHLTAVNILQLEDYLLSVISSEMSANSSLELLKAHAVISRSWLLAQKEKAADIGNGYQSCVSTDTEYIRWYDREDHSNFDVCADDHCQRYQGISRAYTPAVKQAIEATKGEVLTYQHRICDARFSKCCGGMTEHFENTWEPVVHPYLSKVADSAVALPESDLRRETDAGSWILSSPDVFCNTRDPEILSNVLNDYDRETQNFFRWSISFTTEELSALVKERLGIDFGTITELHPIERGVSGRMIKLQITGTKKSLVIGKELVIRKAFSHSHLYSSAFIIEKTAAGFTLKGAGWGHGVGLCQIGAAVMSARGYNYREILAHYFKNTRLEKKYVYNE